MEQSSNKRGLGLEMEVVKRQELKSPHVYCRNWIIPVITLASQVL